MDKWHYQFDKLKRQWSAFNQINSDYKPHDKRQVAKVGVAWVLKLPGEYFKKPVGWEVEIIDTPVGISERCNKLLKWLRHPPISVYDNISLFNDSSDIMLDDSLEIRDFNGYKRQYEHLSLFDKPQQRFDVPPNEYEVFKKTCCECKEKSFKNTSTDYESDIKGSLPRKKDVPYNLSPKTSYFDLPPKNRKISRNNGAMNSIRNHSLYSDFEQELNNHILDESARSFTDVQDTKYSKKTNTPRNHRRHFSKTISPNLTNQGIETSKVLSDMLARNETSVRNEHTLRGNGRNSPIRNHQNNRSVVRGDINNKTAITSTPRRRNTGPHIPSVDAFDDNNLTRGTSLEQYRDTDHIFHPSKDEDLEYTRRSSNGRKNHHRHHRRNNGSKDVSVDIVSDNYVTADFDLSEIREELNER